MDNAHITRKDPAAYDRQARSSQDTLKRPSLFTQYSVLVARDLHVEFRTRQMFTSMGIYAFLVIIIYGAALALTADSMDIMRMAGGLVWVLIVFTSLLGLNRSFTIEKEYGCMEGLLLAPIDRSVIFLAKATANILFMLAVEVIAIPLFCFFFLGGDSLSETAWMALLAILAGTIGMAATGTMLSTITMGTRAKDVLLTVLFIPVTFPLLYACVTATTTAIIGADYWFDLYTVPLLMACAYDIIMTLLCWVLYDFVVSP